MATALSCDALQAPTAREPEILEFQASLAGRSPAEILLAALYRKEGLLARAEATLARALAAAPGLAETRASLKAIRAQRKADDDVAARPFLVRLFRKAR